MSGIIQCLNKILEVCAEILEKEMSINRFQFLRFFEIFPYDFPYAKNEQLDFPYAKNEQLDFFNETFKRKLFTFVYKWSQIVPYWHY